MKISGVRWWIVVLLFLAAALNYVDRQTLSALALTIQPDLGIDDRCYANIVNIFLVAYTIAYLISGKLVDRLGTRTGTAIFVCFWSIANTLTAWVQGPRSMGLCRMMLGLGEAGIWPAASKAVSTWFPAHERAFAIGLYTMGATIGAMLVPALIIPLAAYDFQSKLPLIKLIFAEGTGWRMAFLITGAAGFIWLIPWLLIYRKPRQSKLITEAELRLIEDEKPSGESGGASWSWKQVLTFRPLWLLLIGRLLTDPVWFFYQVWFPKFLNSERGVSQVNLEITWIVYAAAGVGSLGGGWLSGKIIQSGASATKSRLTVMLIAACIMPVSALIATTHSLSLTMVFTAFAIFASLAWLTNISALIVDVVPRHSLGTIFSVIAAGSTLGSVVMNMVIAELVSGGPPKSPGFLDEGLLWLFGGSIAPLAGKGYHPWFMTMAFLHPLALLVIWLGGIHKSGREPAATVT